MVRRIAIVDENDFADSRAIDKQPANRFAHVMKRHGLKNKKNSFQANLNHLKNISADDFRYMYHSGLEISPDYP